MRTGTYSISQRDIGSPMLCQIQCDECNSTKVDPPINKKICLEKVIDCSVWREVTLKNVTPDELIDSGRVLCA